MESESEAVWDYSYPGKSKGYQKRKGKCIMTGLKAIYPYPGKMVRCSRQFSVLNEKLACLFSIQKRDFQLKLWFSLRNCDFSLNNHDFPLEIVIFHEKNLNFPY